MLATERQALILDRLRATGAVRVSDLARELHVSEMTIRRDLDTLTDDGTVRKVHGGATLTRSSSTEEPGFEAKRQLQRAEKEAIARAATALIEPGTSIGLSAGTTTWTFAAYLSTIPELTVVTNSVRIADLLHSSGPQTPEVILTGGVRTPSDALVGPVAVASLQHLHLDLAFLGVHGMDLDAGFTTPNLAEADTNRALVTAAARLVVLADHTKWRTVGLSTIVPIDAADIVVTDAGLPDDARELLDEQVGDVTLADTL